MNGPPLVLYLVSRRATPRALRDTLAALFVVLGAAGLVALAVTGALAFPGAETALTLPAVVAGGFAGHRLHDRVPEHVHGRITTAILVAAALTALVSAA